ncbi:FMN-binding protein [Modestobacter sp. DSM 44400]|uniref:FMN-binding protein n=1 Tax=Modestobacter sp. DSM 44400 TaxID=1550230 RepID=UPI001C312526|nr:FMN-binding protein [Modestobacter sp. DSM 44400]
MSTLTVLVLVFGYHTSTSSTSATASASGGSTVLAPVTGGTGTTSSGTGGTSSTATTVTGDAASTRWGPVQVELTIANGTITDVSVVEYPNNNGQDRQINARALPVLVQETLDAQSAHIDMVSGATVTSDGYVGSLQSALDRAGL